ncbi:NAD-dependent epimerase/dehydratase family protein, partial [Candidatus Uhrbacteria bacterium]|nr:NAD-dependent epimerase/dehydratase family protein [Candidatus Uhrbacteria bacterium]
TGGAGFVGSHVCQLLVDRGHTVHVIDDFSTGKKANLPKRVTVHEMDIRAKSVFPAMRKAMPDAVIHLAASIDLQASLAAPKDDADVNIIGSLNVIEAATAAGVRHFTFASSAAVYDSAGHMPLPEEGATRPSTPYGIAKLAVEHYLHVMHHTRGLHAASLRFANVYGPRQTPKGEAGVVAVFMQKLKKGEAPTIYGDGEQTRDFVYAGDVAAAAVMVVEKAIHGVFNVSTGKEISVKALYDKLATASGVKLEPIFAPARANEDRRSALDQRKAAGVIGWRAETTLDVGLKKTWESLAKK